MPRGKRWTPEEDALVLDLSLSVDEVSRRTRRSYPAVTSRARLLGVRRTHPKRVRWNADMDAVVCDISLTIAEAARRLNRPESTIKARARQLGVRRPKGRRRR